MEEGACHVVRAKRLIGQRVDRCHMRKTEESRSGVEVAIEFHLECPTFQIYVKTLTTTWPTAIRTINKALHRGPEGTRQRGMRW